MVDDDEAEAFGVLNTDETIVILVDEAHRSQTSTLHANLMAALPNAAKIGFTGTPIMREGKKKTEAIFGPFIDHYTIRQAEADGAVVPIFYEGRTAKGAVAGGSDLDELFEDMFVERTPEEIEKLKARYATTGSVLEAPQIDRRQGAFDALALRLDGLAEWLQGAGQCHQPAGDSTLPRGLPEGPR